MARASTRAPIFTSIRESTLERNYKCAKYGKGLLSKHGSPSISESPHKRNSLNVELLKHKHSCSPESPHRKLSSVKSVWQGLDSWLHCSSACETGEKLYQHDVVCSGLLQSEQNSRRRKTIYIRVVRALERALTLSSSICLHRREMLQEFKRVITVNHHGAWMRKKKKKNSSRIGFSPH